MTNLPVADSTLSDFELVELELDAMDSLGDTVADFEGHRINVFGGIPGELVIARVYRYKRRKKNIVSAMVVKVLRSSEYRIQPPCPYYGPCSGCQWQHISYEHQLSLKRRSIANQLSLYPALAKVTIAQTLPDLAKFHYRNHARFTVRFGGQLGFSNRITRKFIRIDHCMLMNNRINNALGQLQDKASETSNLSIRTGTNTGDLLIQPTFQNPSITLPSGQKFYQEKLLETNFKVGSPSFFQVNTIQAERLVEFLRESLGLDGTEVLVDAYAGVGVFAILLAPYVSYSIAIEESSAAIADARENAAGLDNVCFLEDRTEIGLGNLEDKIGLSSKPDIVILDPPRVGCHPDAIDALLAMKPGKVAYVSCDPASLARDLNKLSKGGYNIVVIQPIDMFPQTYHIEAIAIMTLNPS